MSLTLYLHPLSSYCHKVLIALYENGTPFERQIVDLGDAGQREAFRRLWPPAKFPVLRDEARNLTIPESSIIIEYLAQQYPGDIALLPADPAQARETRLRDRFFDLHVHEHLQKIVGDRLRPAERRDALGVAMAHEKLNLAYDLLDALMATRRWAAGEAFSMADCAFLEQTRLGLGLNAQLAALNLSALPIPLAPTDPLDWKRFHNPALTVAEVLGRAGLALLPVYDPIRQLLLDSGLQGGFMSNRDNSYVAVPINNSAGELVVIASRMPSTPATWENAPRMQPAQLRYLSLCSVDFPTQRYWDCLYDEQLIPCTVGAIRLRGPTKIRFFLAQIRGPVAAIAFRTSSAFRLSSACALRFRSFEIPKLAALTTSFITPGRPLGWGHWHQQIIATGGIPIRRSR